MHWPRWNPNQQYNIGDSLEYQGQTYHVIQPHTSQVDWTPSQCPALWGLGRAAGSEIGKPPVPQYQPTQPYHQGGQGDNRLPGTIDHSRDAPKEAIPQPEHHRGIPEPEPHRGFPEPERQRGFPEPDRSRGVPEPDRSRGYPEPDRSRGYPEPDRSRGYPEPDRQHGPPSYTPGDRDHDRDWREKDDDRDRERERERERQRDFERERERERELVRERQREYERERDERERGGDREHHRDREYGNRDREQVYEGEDREMREGHHRGQGDGEYRNPVKYKSSAEWIDDARRRTREINMNGPGERIYWLLAEPGDIPKHAIQAGEDKDGDPTFVSRNFHEGGLHVGWAGLRNAAISYGGRELPLTTFEVLAGDPRGVRWVPSKKRDGRPIEAGYEANGKPLWICQTVVGGQILAGKAASWDSGGYIANEGKEQAVSEYNILCHA